MRSNPFPPVNNMVGTTTIAAEPLYFWPDELNELHAHSVEPGHYRKLPRLPAGDRISPGAPGL